MSNFQSVACSRNSSASWPYDCPCRVPWSAVAPQDAFPFATEIIGRDSPEFLAKPWRADHCELAVKSALAVSLGVYGIRKGNPRRAYV